MGNARVGIPDGESSGGNTRWGMLGWELPGGEHSGGKRLDGNPPGVSVWFSHYNYRFMGRISH